MEVNFAVIVVVGMVYLTAVYGAYAMGVNLHGIFSKIFSMCAKRFQ